MTEKKSQEVSGACCPAHQWSEEKEWLDRFEREHGRPLRILHINNIANYAYVNAKLMRRHGIEADVLCNDFYHIMASPEWEDAVIHGEFGDEFRPDWSRVSVNGYSRPNWFAQGPLQLVYSYHLARKQKKFVKSAIVRRMLEFYRMRLSSVDRVYPYVERIYRLKNRFLFRVYSDREKNESYKRAILRIVWSFLLEVFKSLSYLRQIAQKEPTGAMVSIRRWMACRFAAEDSADVNEQDAREDECRGEKVQKSADIENDLTYYCTHIKRFQELFKYYDVIQGYTTSAVYPLVAGVSNFTAYELGTIRTIPFIDDLQGRVCAYTYKNAPGVFITNVDCIEAADRLKISKERRRVVPHAFDLDSAVAYQSTYAAATSADLPYFLAPARHHWKEGHDSWRKGNDWIVRAAAELRKEGFGFKVVFVEWGQEVEETKKLIRELGLEEVFEWKRPMSKKALWPTYMEAVAVIDQFVAPAMGGVALDAMALGRALITRLDEPSCKLFFGSVPPLMNVKNVAELRDAMRKVLLDPESADQCGKECQEWMKNFHSVEQGLAAQLNMYRSMLSTSAVETLSSKA
ncbi:glycosyltransferase [Tepidicaulis sp.]|uniref:glycosyltransferase n=1 Tax=Tepidicaulis sp. TaxID=1920809 RepID=UPI003B5A0446